MRKALLCTLGPSSLNPRTIGQLDAAGVTSFRVNMSHTELDHLESVLRVVRESTAVPVCLDTEGAQIRTGTLRSGYSVSPGSRVQLVAERARGGPTRIAITPGDVVDRLEEGCRVSIDFDSVVLRVERVAGGVAEGTVLVGGEVGSRKAVTAFPAPTLPAFSPKDLDAIRIALREEVHEFALSFAEHPTALNQLREMVGPSGRVIAKIESRKGVRNLGPIAECADAVLIDRGDLSREVRVEALPLLQKAIIRKANAIGTPVYVATNLLESMVTRRTPTRAEVNDVMNTLLDGADGLVLAAETAIGKYPVEAARMITALMKEFEGSVEGYRIEDLLGAHPLAMGEPVLPLEPRSATAPKPRPRRAR